MSRAAALTDVGCGALAYAPGEQAAALVDDWQRQVRLAPLPFSIETCLIGDFLKESTIRFVLEQRCHPLRHGLAYIVEGGHLYASEAGSFKDSLLRSNAVDQLSMYNDEWPLLGSRVRPPDTGATDVRLLVCVVTHGAHFSLLACQLGVKNSFFHYDSLTTRGHAVAARRYVDSLHRIGLLGGDKAPAVVPVHTAAAQQGVSCALWCVAFVERLLRGDDDFDDMRDIDARRLLYDTHEDWVVRVSQWLRLVRSSADALKEVRGARRRHICDDDQDGVTDALDRDLLALCRLSKQQFHDGGGVVSPVLARLYVRAQMPRPRDDDVLVSYELDWLMRTTEAETSCCVWVCADELYVWYPQAQTRRRGTVWRYGTPGAQPRLMGIRDDELCCVALPDGPCAVLAALRTLMLSLDARLVPSARLLATMLQHRDRRHERGRLAPTIDDLYGRTVGLLAGVEPMPADRRPLMSGGGGWACAEPVDLPPSHHSLHFPDSELLRRRWIRAYRTHSVQQCVDASLKQVRVTDRASLAASQHDRIYSSLYLDHVQLAPRLSRLHYEHSGDTRTLWPYQVDPVSRYNRDAECLRRIAASDDDDDTVSSIEKVYYQWPVFVHFDDAPPAVLTLWTIMSIPLLRKRHGRRLIDLYEEAERDCGLVANGGVASLADPYLHFHVRRPPRAFYHHPNRRALPPLAIVDERFADVAFLAIWSLLSLGGTR